LKIKVVISVFIIILAGTGILVYCGQNNTRSDDLYYSGTIEAKQADLSFLINGRVMDIAVDEGQKVEKDRILATLDKSELLARYEQTQANADLAEKILQKTRLSLEILAKTLPAEVDRARAGVEALQSQLDELEAGNRDQDIEKARLSFLAAKTAMEDAKKDTERQNALFKEKIISEKERDAATLRFEIALRSFQSSRQTHELLKEGPRNETIATARAKLAEGKAILTQAENNLMKIDAEQKELEAAVARVESARADLRLSETQLGYAELKAPFNGIITSRNIESGEVVSTGREVLSLSDLSTVDLKIYVDETDIGKIHPGQDAEVKVDTFPDKVYSGKVSFISPEGEFTPKIIQTHKERVKLVYLVRIAIPNSDLELKSGMPADAWLQ
jgi:HlyD family secretion protein